MALETEDDYQDKIDDLMKEVEKLYDEGTDKGFKLKRLEEIEKEFRALETHRDYQAAYNDEKGELEKVKTAFAKVSEKLVKQIEALEQAIKDARRKLEVEEEEANSCYKEIKDKMNKIFDEAKSKGYKLKRGKVMDFETRKQEILNSLEARAIYKSEKDYIKTVKSMKEKIKELEDEFDRYYTKSAIDKHVKSELESQERLIRARYEREANSIKSKIAYWNRLLDNAHDEAKKQGFKVQRSYETDFEVRALETEKDYQKKLNEIVDENNDVTSEYRDMLARLERFKEKASATARVCKKKFDKYMAEAKSKGFNPKVMDRDTILD